MHPPRLLFAGAGLETGIVGSPIASSSDQPQIFAEGLAKALVFTRRPST